jgi:chaperonin GroES
MTFQPLNDNILVSIQDDSKTADGLIVPGIADSIHARGIVVAVGNGLRKEDGSRVPIDVVEGDLIFFSKYSTNSVEYKDDETGETLFIIKECDVYGVLK